MGDKPTWIDQVSSDLQTEDNLNILGNYETITDASKALLELTQKTSEYEGKVTDYEGRIGTLDEQIKAMVKIPGEDSTDEEKKEFLTKFGVPEAVDGYGLDELAKDEVGKQALQGFLESGLSKSQAKSMAQFLGKNYEAQIAAQKAASEKAVAEYRTSLGKDADVQFKMAEDAIGHFFDKEDVEAAKDMIMSNPKQIAVFSRIGTLIKEAPRIFTPRPSQSGSGVMYESMKGLD